MKGIIDIHSEHSSGCAMRIKDICERASGLGLRAVAVTDTDTLTGTSELMHYAPKYGLKPVPGVNLSLRENGTLTLLAADETGYHGLVRAVSQIPVDLEDLSGIFGEESLYHSHVYAVSDTANGILTELVLQEQNPEKTLVTESLEELEDKKGLVTEEKEEYQLQISQMEAQRKKVSEKRGRSFARKEQIIADETDPKRKEELTKRLEEEKADCLMAEKEYVRLGKKISAARKRLKELVEEETRLTDAISVKRNGPVRYDPVQTAAETACKLRDIFGNRFLIGLSFHGEEKEKKALPLLEQVRLRSGIPVILTGECCLPDDTDKERFRLQTGQFLRTGQWKEISKEKAAGYSMKDEESYQSDLNGLVSEEIIREAMTNLHFVLNACSVRFSVSEDPFEERKVLPCLAENRLDAKKALSLAGEILERKGLRGAVEEENFLSEAVPADCTALAGCESALRPFLQNEIRREVWDTACSIEGLLTGYRVDEQYGLQCPASPDTYPVIALDGKRVIAYPATYAKDAGLTAVRKNVNAYFSEATMEIAAFVGRMRGIRIDPERISFDGRVMEEIFSKDDTIGIPYCDKPEVHAALEKKIPTSILSLAYLLQEAMDNGSLAAGSILPKWENAAREMYAHAWMKTHYRQEYLVGSCNEASYEQLPALLEECRKVMTLRGPDINYSAAGFTLFGGEMWFGLSFIRGVEKNAETLIANRKHRYASLQDFLVRSGADRSTVNALTKAGALDAFCKDRAQLLSNTERLMEQAARVRRLDEKIRKEEESLAEFTGSDGKKEDLRWRIEEEKKQRSFILQAISSTPLHGQGNALENIRMEREVLPVVISSHPIDSYVHLTKKTTPISAVHAGAVQAGGEVHLAGVVTAADENTTRTGMPMADFVIEDRTGSIQVKCFPKQYAKYGDLLKTGAVLELKGKVSCSSFDQRTAEIYPYWIRVPETYARPAIISSSSLSAWDEEVSPKLSPWLKSQGSRVIAFGKEEGKLKATGYFIEENVMIPGLEMCYARHCFQIPDEEKRKEGKFV